MVYFCGDTHGTVDFQKLLDLKRDHNPSPSDVLFLLGDCGVLFYSDKRIYQRYIDLYDSLGFTIFYIDGNHENFPLINTFPIVE